MSKSSKMKKEEDKAPGTTDMTVGLALAIIGAWIIYGPGPALLGGGSFMLAHGVLNALGVLDVIERVCRPGNDD